MQAREFMSSQGRKINFTKKIKDPIHNTHFLYQFLIF